ncbi:MAG: ABC transporter substrate-binding protein [Thiobacillaceae bacterium]|nr:ABC transporter substrate-binding protein [Thiobacillaceae bacterium]MCX7673112.1 ABC transporter substrate-binding protein [Thiobacillaceae bacterium]MDW8323492.1 ABC transporter substrate-binding protein [Burkholderiales bacterium]
MRLLICAWALLTGMCAPLLRAAQPVTLAVPGPGSLNYLPIELIKKIGADRAEGLDLRLRYFSGGPLAVRDMLEGYSDFAVLGAPALAEFAARGEPVVSLAAVSRRPAFVLMVASRLKGEVRRVADLRGRVIGINSSNRQARSTSQQMAEHLLRRAGVDPDKEVNFLAAGQTLEEQRAALASGAVDALMGDEPFASQLRKEGVAFYLLDLHEPEVSRRLLGGDEFLYAQLATRRDLLMREPDKAARMVRALRRSLEWIARTTPQAIVAQLDSPDVGSRHVMLDLLRRHKDLFSPDGSFTREQLRTVEAFYRANQTAEPAASRFAFETLIEPRYAGLRTR